MIAGGNPVWLPEITHLWSKISPSKFNLIYSWPKDNELVTALVLLVQRDFGKNQFSLDCDHFTVFDYLNSESVLFLSPPCLFLRYRMSLQMLLLSACCRDVLRSGTFCALLTALQNLSWILHSKWHIVFPNLITDEQTFSNNLWQNCQFTLEIYQDR